MVSLCVVCLVWSPGGGGRFLLAVPPGDWSAPPPAAGTLLSRLTESRRATGELAPISPCGCRDPSTFYTQHRGFTAFIQQQDTNTPLPFTFSCCRDSLEAVGGGVGSEDALALAQLSLVQRVGVLCSVLPQLRPQRVSPLVKPANSHTVNKSVPRLRTTDRQPCALRSYLMSLRSF